MHSLRRIVFNAECIELNAFIAFVGARYIVPTMNALKYNAMLR
jgi:hypothetical protein